MDGRRGLVYFVVLLGTELPGMEIDGRNFGERCEFVVSVVRIRDTCQGKLARFVTTKSRYTFQDAHDVARAT